MIMPFHMRLNCPNSYAVEEDFRLRCEIGDTICDGEVYDCCLWDMSFAEELALMQKLLEQEECHAN